MSIRKLIKIINQSKKYYTKDGCFCLSMGRRKKKAIVVYRITSRLDVPFVETVKLLSRK